MIFKIADSDQFPRPIQLLHKLSGNLITLEQSTQRDISNIDHLLRDRTRLWNLTRRHSNAVPIDGHSHEQIRDDLLHLQDFCDNRHWRIQNLRQGTHSFITLLYSSIIGHDSSINSRIASQSADIARDARKDSLSMKVIASITLLYLPATFVCSLFGTNLVGYGKGEEAEHG